MRRKRRKKRRRGRVRRRRVYRGEDVCEYCCGVGCDGSKVLCLVEH